MVSPQNIQLYPAQPELMDLLNLFGKQLKLEMNCHHIGTIQSFNPTNQTAQATINYPKTYNQVDDVGTVTVTSQDYAVLIDCPVVCLGGGTGALTFPIESGDECIIMFNDRDMDNWFAGSSSSATATTRLHAFPDAIIMVGVRSLPNVITEYDASSVTLQYEGNLFQIFSDKVLVTLTTGVTFELDQTGKLKITNLTGEFVASLIQLFTDVQNGLVTTMLGPEPLVMPTFVTDLAVLQSFKG